MRPVLLLLLLLAAVTTSSRPAPVGSQPRAEREALRIHRAAIVVDGHNDITTPMVDEGYDLGTPSAGKYHTDLKRLREGGVTAQFFAIYVAPRYAREGGSFLDPRAVQARRENARRFAAEIEAIRARTRDHPEEGEPEIQRLLATGAPPVTVARLADHIEHVARIAGSDHVGLGSDFDGGIRPPVDVADVSRYPTITAELLRRGMSERDVRRVLGEKVLRAFAQAERVARGPAGDE